MSTEQRRHFGVLVVTKDRPTEEVLASALAPFGPSAGDEAKFDWWQLGGRYDGRLIPRLPETITAGVENELTGVDALQLENLDFYSLLPKVVLFNDQWHEAVAAAFLATHRVMPLVLADPEVIWSDEEINADTNGWDCRFDEIMDPVPRDYWISMVDCRKPLRKPGSLHVASWYPPVTATRLPDLIRFPNSKGPQAPPMDVPRT
jgi:hypothetical protein